MRREWIEIQILGRKVPGCYLSPSMRREWIEIKFWQTIAPVSYVSLHAEGVD